MTESDPATRERSPSRSAAAMFSANVPLHHQIAQLLRQRLLGEGEGPSGGAVTEQGLCDEFGVSRSTVRQALAHLKREGLLTSRRGVGTRMANARVADPYVRSSGDPLHATLGTRVRVVSIDRVAPRAAVAAHLGLAAGERAVRIVRVHELQGSPLSVVVSYLPAALGDGLTKSSLGTGPLHAFIEQRAGSPLRRSVHGVRVARADAWIAPMLGVPLAEPVLYVCARAFLADGRAVRWTDNFFREDRYEYEAVIEWPSAGEAPAPAPVRAGTRRPSQRRARTE